MHCLVFASLRMKETCIEILEDTPTECTGYFKKNQNTWFRAFLIFRVLQLIEINSLYA